MKLVKSLFSVLLACGLVYCLNRPWGPVPVLGNFLNPFTGFWQNWEKPYDPAEEIVLKLDSLQDDVTIRFDDTGVPHIFAKNNHDLFYAQGYVTARDRLWQMDLQVRAAAGRLSEVLGKNTLEIDRKSRLLGMGYGAEANLKVAMTDKISREALLSYTQGVNAYISQLKPREFPVEYKLLGYAPEKWQPINCMYMQEQMILTLAGRSDDLNMTNILDQYGQEVIDELFPDYPMLRESPVIPTGTPWNFKRLPIPLAPPVIPYDAETSIKQKAETLLPQQEAKIEGIGSNNWAISAEKSSTGYPILANDPHLELTLPSIWYQLQLQTPDLNVYGVSLPGIPSVVIGFNQNVAWGVTNVDADVHDLYEIIFNNNTKSKYWHDRKWKPTRIREEVIRIKGQAPHIEKVVYTHHGPVFDQEDSTQKVHHYATKWIGHEPGNGFSTFYDLNRAKDYDDYRKALSHYTAPAQNFVFADNGKNIAITVNGKLPLKYKDQGKFLLDGRLPEHEWQGWIPADQNPTVKNPPRGFVSSANQSSTDPTYPYYINWSFAPSERAIRINERLQAMNKATVDSLRSLQNDNFSVMARTILPALLPYLRSSPLTPVQKAAEITLTDWNFVNAPESIAASIFETWIPILREAIWSDDFGSEKLPMTYPSRDRTFYMILKQPTAKWFDNVKTPQIETIGDIVLSSYKASLDTLAARRGPMSPEWQWYKVKGTEIRHLSRQIKPFNSGLLKTGGGSSIVNAITKTHGPSWRMIVELGPSPKAYGIYPGGQSGNPGSPYYLNLLPKWEKGELNELVYLSSPDQKNDRLTTSIILKKK